MLTFATIRAFLLGIKEFRLTYTTHLADHAVAYDTGREFAHRVTLRRFEP